MIMINEQHITNLATYELKATELKPEHVGKLNFYLAVIDDVLKAPEDNPSIGLLLCRKNNKVVAEYTLKRTDSAIGIAEYCLWDQLPKELQKDLPDPALLTVKLNQEKVTTSKRKDDITAAFGMYQVDKKVTLEDIQETIVSDYLHDDDKTSR